MAAQAINPKLRAVEAQLELVRRAQARKSLAEYCGYTASWFIQAPHIQLILPELELVKRYIETEGAEGNGRLMINLHPRAGKTTSVAQKFPGWLMGNLPDTSVGLISYGADLAEESSKAVREDISSPRYSAIFGELSGRENPVRLSSDSSAKGRWNLDKPHRGGMVAVGIGGALVGFGFNLLIVDDPFKNREEAEREAHRELVRTWWRSTAYTRLEKGGAIVIVNTRWHPEDLPGSMLMMMATDDHADQYKIVSIPALAYNEEDYPKDEEEFRRNLLGGVYLPYQDPLGRKPGEAMWPDRVSAERLEQIRINVGDYEFAAQFQQLPRLMKGNFFDYADFQIIEKAPDGLSWYRYADVALGEKRTSDFNACVAEGMDKDGNLYLRDMIYVHLWEEFKERAKAVMLSREERGTRWAVETVAFSALAFKEFMKDKELARVAIEAITPEKDKVTRARPLQTRAKAGKVFLVRGPWNRAFLDEAVKFPRGRHDDQVDSASGGLGMIAEGTPRGAELVSFV